MQFDINKILKRKDGNMELLIVVDMVNGFIKKGNMADKYINHIINPNIELIKKINKEGGNIVFIKDTHKIKSREFDRFPVHCLEESEESKVIDELKEYEKVAFTKNSTSAMYAKGFKEYIDNLKNLKKIILSGCCTDICVMNLALDLQNYFDENNKNIDIIVPKDVVETYSGPNHNREEYNEIAFKIMNNAGIKLVKTWRNI